MFLLLIFFFYFAVPFTFCRVHGLRRRVNYSGAPCTGRTYLLEWSGFLYISIQTADRDDTAAELISSNLYWVPLRSSCLPKRPVDSNPTRLPRLFPRPAAGSSLANCINRRHDTIVRAETLEQNRGSRVLGAHSSSVKTTAL